LTVEHLHPPRRFKLRQGGFDVIVATHKTIDLVGQTRVHKLRREMRPGSHA
jgi:hypothetical protein